MRDEVYITDSHLLPPPLGRAGVRDEVERTRHYFFYLFFDVTKALTLTLQRERELGKRAERATGSFPIANFQLPIDG